MKISITGIQARNKALKGATYLANTIKETIGPFGSNALLEKGSKITNDGYTISKELCNAIEDEFERRGAIAIHEASAKTNDQVGDATSSSEALAIAIIDQSIKLLPKEGTFAGKMKATDLIKKISQEKEEIIEKLEKEVKQIETEEELIASARVSVEDDELANLIGSAQWKLGKDGIIIAEETNEVKCSVEFVKGIRIDNGLGTAMIMNNQEKQQLEVEKCKIILTNHTLQDFNSLAKILDTLVKSGIRDIIIVARAFTQEAIKTCMENISNGIRIYPLNAPYVNQREVMLDLAAITGSKYIDSEEASLEDMTMDDVGTCSKVVARRYDAIITGTEESQPKVTKRLIELQEKILGNVSEFERKELEKRISQLTNGTALLKVGAETDIERKRKKDKCDDAVNAVRLAFQGGVVKGGGLAFKEIAETLPEDYILKKPLTCIYDQIMYSAPEGFKIEEWVKDPFLVLKSALTNACSVAGTFATINCIITEENPKQCKCNGQSN